MTNKENDPSNVFFQNITPETDNSNISDSTDIPNNSINFIPDNNNGMKPNKKHKEKSMFLPIAAVCLILVIAVSAVTFVLLSGNDKKKTSLKDQPSIFEGLFNFETPISDYLGTKDIKKELLSGKTEFSGKLLLKDYYDSDENDEYIGCGVDYSLKRNAVSKEIQFDMNVKDSIQDIFSANMYMNKDKLQIQVPETGDEVYTVEYDKLTEIINTYLEDYSDYGFDSASDKMSLDIFNKYFNKENITLSLGDMTEYYGDSDIISTYIYAIQETYPEEYKKILNGITSADAPKDRYGNSGTVYTISEDSIELFVKCLLTVSLDNKDIYNQYTSVFHDYIKLYAVETDSDETDTAESEKEQLDKMRTQLNSISSAFAMFFNEDITLTVWTNKNGLLTGLESCTDINLAGEIVTVSFVINSNNDANPGENMDMMLSFECDGESVSLCYNRATVRGEILNVTDTFSINVDGESFIIISDEMLNTTNNAYNYSLTMNFSDTDDEMIVTEEMAISLSGSIKDLVKGKSLNLVLDSLSIELESENMFTLEGNIAINTEDVSISAPKGKQIDFTDLIRNELEDSDYFNDEYDIDDYSDDEYNIGDF